MEVCEIPLFSPLKEVFLGLVGNAGRRKEGGDFRDRRGQGFMEMLFSKKILNRNRKKI